MSDRPGTPFFARLPLDRRGFFQQVSGGICGAALGYLLGEDLRGESVSAAVDPPTDVKPRPPHFEAKAKSVIHLFMNGGPSQMDLFDPKPALDKHHGQSLVDKLAGEIENFKSAGALMYACSDRQRAEGCILVARFKSLEGVKGVAVEVSHTHVYCPDSRPEITGYMIVPKEYPYR